MSALNRVLAAFVPREDPLRRLGMLDWIFVFLGCLTLWYFVFILLELRNEHSALGFDFMPVTAGLALVPLGWRAARVSDQVGLAITGLNNGAAFSTPDQDSLEEFLADLHRWVRRWRWGTGTGIALVMAVGFVYAAANDVPIEELSAMMLGLVGLLALVMLATGGLVGSLLGALVGYGQLHRVLARHGIKLAGVSTAEARTAIRGLESVSGYAVLATTVLCQWMAAWFLMWHLGFDPNQYSELWYGLYLVLWLISFSLYVVAALWPSLSLQRRLDELYESADARHALDQQMLEAQRDLTELRAAIRDGQWRRRAELNDLERFIAAIDERRFRSPLVRPAVLYTLLVLNFGSMVVPWLLLGRGFA